MSGMSPKAWQKSYLFYNHIQSKKNVKTELYKSKAEQQNELKIPEGKEKGPPLKRRGETKTTTAQAQKTQKTKTVLTKPQKNENEHLKHNGNKTDNQTVRKSEKENCSFQETTGKPENNNSGRVCQNGNPKKSAKEKSKSAVIPRIIKVKQAETSETEKPKSAPSGQHSQKSKTGLKGKTGLKDNGNTAITEPVEENQIKEKNSQLQKKQEVVNQKSVSTQVVIETKLKGYSNIMTQTVATQTSQTLLDLANGIRNEKPIEFRTGDLQPLVTQKLSVGQKNSVLWLNPNKNDVIPPTPDGPRFSQDGTQLTYTHPGVQNEMLKHLHALQTQGVMCDVLIRTCDIDFKAHKVVLAASCPYFANLFKDIRTVRIDRLILEGLSAQSVASMLGYFYLATLIIDAEDVEDLLDAAYYFQTTEVIQICTDYLELNLNINNCFVFYHISEKHNIEGLRAKTFRFICWNFNSIVKELRFLEISVETLIKVISSNSVKVKSEEEVYTAVWNWFEYNIEDRKCHLPKLVMYIHFEVMDADFLQDTVKAQMYEESELCRKKVDDAINMIKNKVDLDARKISNYRQSSDNIYLFSSSSSAGHMLNIKTCKCTPAPELQLPKPLDQEYHVVVKAGKTLYLLSKTNVLMFNVDTMNWDAVGKGQSILETGICCTKSMIYVIGGKPNGRIFWGFNIKSRRWEKLPDMEHDRRSPAVAVMGNTKPKIFVAGGYSLTATNVLSCMEFFVASENCWKSIKQTMSQPRFQASMIINNDKVYVVGGRSLEKSYNDVEYYDRATSKWKTCEGSLSEVKLDSSLIIFEGKIYCVGGKGCCSIEVLEDSGKSKKWTYLGKLDSTMCGHHCVVYQPKEEKKEAKR